MLDREGYRPNVGIILTNQRFEVFWGKRIREHSWQFPQGGIKKGESPEDAMFRELYEEVAASPAYDDHRRQFAAERAEALGKDHTIVSGEIGAKPAKPVFSPHPSETMTMV